MDPCGLNATDEDDGQDVFYFITGNNEARNRLDNVTYPGCFETSICSGQLRLTEPRCLDYENTIGQANFSVEVMIQDNGICDDEDPALCAVK